jgi:hypothetical protein
LNSWRLEPKIVKNWSFRMVPIKMPYIIMIGCRCLRKRNRLRMAITPRMRKLEKINHFTFDTTLFHLG